VRVISFVTQKGGSGKSTTAASIAVAAIESGRRVFVLELDRQGTLSDWIDSRQVETGPDFERVDAAVLDKAISTLADSGYDLVVIDTPGIDSPAANAAMRVADLCLIPCRPTATDLRGCLPTVQSMMRLGKPFAFVLAQCPPRSPRVDETRAGLAALGLIAEPPIVSRTDHQDAMAAGQGVTEFNAAAATEIRALWSWIERKFGVGGEAKCQSSVGPFYRASSCRLHLTNPPPSRLLLAGVARRSNKPFISRPLCTTSCAN
jgi:chromosome partitioning protein